MFVIIILVSMVWVKMKKLKIALIINYNVSKPVYASCNYGTPLSCGSPIDY